MDRGSFRELPRRLPGPGFLGDAALAVDPEGRFLALRARLLADVGAYLFPNTPAVPTTTTKLVTGAYMIEEVDVEVLGVATHKVPTGPYRGAGRPEAAYLAERLADLAARSSASTRPRSVGLTS